MKLVAARAGRPRAGRLRDDGRKERPPGTRSQAPRGPRPREHERAGGPRRRPRRHPGARHSTPRWSTAAKASPRSWSCTTRPAENLPRSARPDHRQGLQRADPLHQRHAGALAGAHGGRAAAGPRHPHLDRRPGPGLRDTVRGAGQGRGRHHRHGGTGARLRHRVAERIECQRRHSRRHRHQPERARPAGTRGERRRHARRARRGRRPRRCSPRCPRERPSTFSSS